MVDNCDLPLVLELIERVEVDDETLPYAEEDWDCPDQTETDKGVQPDCPWKHAVETRQSKKGRNKKKYNLYGEDFVKNRNVLSDMMESLVGLDEVAVPPEIELVNDMDQDLIDDRSEPIVEFEPEVEQTHEQKLMNLRLHEWLHDLPADQKGTILTIRDVDKNDIKYVSHDNAESNWVAPDGPLRVPESNLDLLDFERSTGTSLDIFVRGVGVGLTNTEKLVDQLFSVPKCVRLARMSEKSYDLLTKINRAVPKRSEGEMQYVVGEEFMRSSEGNLSEFQKKRRVEHYAPKFQPWMKMTMYTELCGKWNRCWELQGEGIEGTF